MGKSYEDIINEAKAQRDNGLTIEDTIGDKIADYEADRKIHAINLEKEKKQLAFKMEQKRKEEEQIRKLKQLEYEQSLAKYLDSGNSDSNKDNSKDSKEGESKSDENEDVKDESNKNNEAKESPTESDENPVEDDDFNSDDLNEDVKDKRSDSDFEDSSDESDSNSEDDLPADEKIKEEMEQMSIEGDENFNPDNDFPDMSEDLGNSEFEEFNEPEEKKSIKTKKVNNPKKVRTIKKRVRNQPQVDNSLPEKEKLNYINQKIVNPVSLDETRNLYNDNIGSISASNGGFSKIDVSNKLMQMIQEEQGLFISASKKDIVNGFLCVHLNVKNPRDFVKDETVLSTIRFLKIENPIVSVDKTLTAFHEKIEEMFKKIDMYEYMISYLLAERTGARNNVDVLGINDFNLVDGGVLKLKDAIEDQYEDYQAKLKRKSGRPIR